MIVKLNGVPADFYQAASDQLRAELEQAVSITETSSGLYNLCIDGQCTEVTRQNLNFFVKLFSRVHDHFGDILQRLIEGGF